MKLYDYLKSCEDGIMVTVIDSIYDLEVYFDADFDDIDEWQKNMLELSKLVEIEKFSNNFVECNFTELIEKNIDKFKKVDLFYIYNIDNIMADFESILSGYVSEKWLEKFVNCLK